MSRTREPSKGRYRTIMPIFITDIECKSTKSKSNISAKRDANRSLEPKILSSTSYEELSEFALDADLNQDTASAPAESNSKQTLLFVDSLLPYQRSLQQRKHLCSFDQTYRTDDADSSSRERLTPPELQSSTYSSDSSYAPSDELDIDHFDLDSSCQISSQLATPRFTSSSSPAKPRNEIGRRCIAPWCRPEKSSYAHLSTSELLSQIEQRNSPTLSKRVPNSPVSTILPARSSTRVSPVEYPSAERTAWQANSKANSFQSNQQQGFFSAPRTTSQPYRKSSSGISACSSRSGKRATEVHYEYVDGVKLDTQPSAAKEKKSGLSLPEVEAKDIRQIVIDGDSCDEDERGYESVFNTMTSHFARPPPSIGSGHHNSARSISPKPVLKPREHVFVDGYSQACKTQVSGPLADSSRHIHLKLENGSRDGNSFQSVQSSLRGRSSVVRNILSFPPSPISEHSREDLLDGFDTTTFQSAEPPSIGLEKEFKEQENAMTRGLQAAKSLVKIIS